MGVIDTTANILLCNQALGLLGAGVIELNGTDQNHVYCETFFEDSLKEILAAHKWNFAEKDGFAIQTTDPLFGYDNAFTKPSDCIKVWRVAEKNNSDFKVKGNLILTDEGETPDAWVTATAYIAGELVTVSSVTYLCAISHTSGTWATDLAAVKWVSQAGDYAILPVEYVYYNSTLSTWPIYAKRCAVLKLASDLCSPIKQESKTALDLQAMLYGSARVRGYLNMACSFDAQEGGGEEIQTDTWLNSRL